MSEVPRISARAIIIRDNKILLVNAEANTRGEDTWCTPGGGIEKMEDLQSGLKREIYEEIGLNVKIEDIISVSEYINEKLQYHQIDILFLCRTSDFSNLENWQDREGVVVTKKFFSCDELQSLNVFPVELKNGFWLPQNSKVPIYKGSYRKNYTA